MNHIFFSYSRTDSDSANQIVDALRANGFLVWIDQNIPGSDNWVRSIETGISEAGAMVVLWSKDSATSEWVDKEVDRGLNRAFRDGLPVFPLMLDDTPLKGRLIETQYISLAGDFEFGIKKLIKDLSQKTTIRWPRLGFDSNLSLVRQKTTREVDGLPLIAVPLLRSQNCEVFVVGAPEYRLNKPSVIRLCLHFFQDKGDDVLLGPVYNSFAAHDDFLALYITGPFDGSTNRFGLDNEKQAEWLESVNITFEALKAVAVRDTQVQIFALAPNALTAALGMKLGLFWSVELYNYRRATQDYVCVLDNRQLVEV